MRFCQDAQGGGWSGGGFCREGGGGGQNNEGRCFKAARAPTPASKWSGLVVDRAKSIALMCTCQKATGSGARGATAFDPRIGCKQRGACSPVRKLCPVRLGTAGAGRRTSASLGWVTDRSSRRSPWEGCGSAMHHVKHHGRETSQCAQGKRRELDRG